MKSTRLALVSVTALSASLSFATTWVFDYNPTNAEQNDGAGRINNIKTTFNDQNQRLTFSVNVGPTPTGSADGFWLAMNDGPNPKGHAGELALVYFDVFSSGGPSLTTYAYNGFNGDTSFKDGSPASGTQAPDKIASSRTDSSWINSINVVNNGNGSRTMSFDIDAAVLNGHTPKYPGSSPWTGMQFDNKIGMWFHTVDKLTSGYGADGFLNKWEYEKQGWVDFSDKQAVPEPTTMGIVAILGAIAARRRKKTA